MPGFTDLFNPYGGATNPQYTSAVAPAIAGAAAAFPAATSGLYGSASQALGSYGQALSGLGNAYASNYGAYAGGLGNLANNYTNQSQARYGANAMAEAARQGAVGNIGSAALGAYGNTAGQALQAWATNQTAYNKALSDMYGANQYAMSQYGQSRNSALAGLGDSYAKAAGGLAPSTMASNIDFSFMDGGMGGGMDGGFSATGPDGSIGSGSYSSGGVPAGGMSLTGSKVTNPGSMSSIIDPTYGGIDKAMTGVTDNYIFDTLNRNGQSGLDRLDRQHYTSRSQPQQMMNSALGGLMALGNTGYGQSNRGMDQFYDAQESSFDPGQYAELASGLAGQMGRGYYDSMNNISGNVNLLNNGWKDNRAQFDASTANLGNQFTGLFGTPNTGRAALENRKAALQGQLADYMAAGYDMRTDRRRNAISELDRMLAGYADDPVYSSMMPRYTT